MTLPKLHTQPEHDPIPSQNPTEPQQEVPDHDPPPFPEKAEVLFGEDEVAR